MLRINKASEYGVLALGYIGGSSEALSARQVSEKLQIPYEITAKTLQRLKEAGYIESTMGTNGGYKLASPLNQISFAQIIKALEGPLALVECSEHSGRECSRTSSCGLKNGMKKINERLDELLESIKLDEFAETNNGEVINGDAVKNETHLS